MLIFTFGYEGGYPFLMRIGKVTLLAGILFSILIARIFYLEIVQGNFYYSLSNKNCIRLIPLEGARGRILDRNNEVIVDNQISYTVSVIPQEFKQKASTLSQLALLLDTSASSITKNIKKDFISSFTPVTVAKDVEKKTAFLIEENKLELPGVIVQIIPKRRYPYHDVASHLLGYLAKIDSWRITKLKEYGYTMKDCIGFGGIEESLEQLLRAQEGGTQIQVDHRGRLHKVLGFKEPSSGKDVGLTIDIKVQKIIEEAFAGRKGAAVLIEPDTGEIIALVSSPGFYPGAFLEEESAEYVRSLLSHPDTPLINRAITGQYPVGSVFKAISATAALETNKITPDKRFFCPGKLMVGRKEFKCWSTHGSQDLIEALTHSCNVYFYHLAIMLGPDCLSEYALRFGFGRPTGIELPHEVSGHVPSVFGRRMKLRNWYDGDTANFGIGQGDLLVTPLQAARLMSLIANGARGVKPTIIRKIGLQEITPQPTAHLGIGPDGLKVVIEGLKQVVNAPTGTANIGWGDLKIAGKTGTAQVHTKLSHGWFCGFLPYDKPRIAFCFFLENTGPSINAVILAHQVFTKMKEENLL